MLPSSRNEHDAVLLSKHEIYARDAGELRAAIRIELDAMPTRKAAIEAYERMEARELPGLFAEIVGKVVEDTNFFQIFSYEELFPLLNEGARNFIRVDKKDSSVMGETLFNGKVVLAHNDLGRSYSERLLRLLCGGDIGAGVLEHENAHRRTFSPVNDVNFFSWLESQLDSMHNKPVSKCSHF